MNLHELLKRGPKTYHEALQIYGTFGRIASESAWKNRNNPDDKYSRVATSVDYDPDDLLLSALHSVGIECRGSFFSARNILYEKTHCNIYINYVEVTSLGNETASRRP